jgi:hypothetical protein
LSDGPAAGFSRRLAVHAIEHQRKRSIRTRRGNYLFLPAALPSSKAEDQVG